MLSGILLISVFFFFGSILLYCVCLPISPYFGHREGKPTGKDRPSVGANFRSSKYTPEAYIPANDLALIAWQNIFLPQLNYIWAMSGYCASENVELSRLIKR